MIHPDFTKTLWLLVMAQLVVTTSLFAQPLRSDQEPAFEITATYTEEAPRIDGKLDDEVWKNIPPITDFVQLWPQEGAEATESSEVRFSLFFPEKREFFLERSGLFEHGNSRSTQTFFSRRIGLTNQILAGARMTGQVGPVSIGLLNIETGEKMNQLFGLEPANIVLIHCKKPPALIAGPGPLTGLVITRVF